MSIIEFLREKGLLEDKKATFTIRFADGRSFNLGELIEEYEARSKNEFIQIVRQNFAKYRSSEGCGCCRDNEGHEEYEGKLGELLKAVKYEDGSGYDWKKDPTEEESNKDTCKHLNQANGAGYMSCADCGKSLEWL